MTETEVIEARSEELRQVCKQCRIIINQMMINDGVREMLQNRITIVILVLLDINKLRDGISPDLSFSTISRVKMHSVATKPCWTG